MLNSINGTDSVSRKELSMLAMDFLKAIARKIKSELGPNPGRIQKSVWMVRDGPNCERSHECSRKILDKDAIWKIANEMLRKGFSEQQEMKIALSTPSIKDNTNFIQYLLNNWLKLKDPFEFEDPYILKLLDEFADAVLHGKIVIRSRTAIGKIDMASLPISIEENCVNIHQISAEELWELGDLEQYNMFYPMGPTPSETWKILDVQLKCDIPKVFSIEKVVRVRDSVLITLRLLSPASFRIIDMGSSFNYLSPGTYRSIDASRTSMGRGGGLNEEMINLLLISWPRMREIMESDSHYLRLPAQRLLEGTERKKPEDAILDYAIGLERLLTAGIENELSYRFALRGATILSMEYGNKDQYYENLKNFYALRSSIIHGSIRNKVHKLSPNDACLVGEDYLRRVWWWFFSNGFTDAKEGLTKGTKKIDDRILSNFIR